MSLIFHNSMILTKDIKRTGELKAESQLAVVRDDGFQTKRIGFEPKAIVESASLLQLLYSYSSAV